MPFSQTLKEMGKKRKNSCRIFRFLFVGFGLVFAFFFPPAKAVFKWVHIWR